MLQASEAKINTALDLALAAVLKGGSGHMQWSSAQDMYKTIDSIQEGHNPWIVTQVCYNGPLPDRNPPAWMVKSYDLCFRDIRALLHEQMACTEFNGHFDYQAYKQFNGKGDRVWTHLMSGDWAWKESVCIYYLLASF